MTHKGLSDLVSASWVAGFLILTALGNAWVMMIASALCLVAYRLILGRRMLRGGALVAVIAAGVSMALTLVALAARR